MHLNTFMHEVPDRETVYKQVELFLILYLSVFAPLKKIWKLHHLNGTVMELGQNECALATI